jgi:hypothetical protein
MNANGQSHCLLSTLSNLLSSREAARGSWSERAIRSAPIRWGLEAPCGSLPLRSARVRAMASLGMARRASLGPTKVNPLRLIGQGDLHPIPAGGPFPKTVAPGDNFYHAV